ncbi:MAG TPA: phosphatase PAP2 family protein [Pseudolysinimonas sp.]|nr:phosphatase PAP2 family protein [Pseudolysinimonas sp.]
MSNAPKLPLRRRATDWHAKFVVEERYVDASERRRTYIGATALIAVGLVAFLYLVVSVVTHSGFELLDRPVERWFDAQRSGSTTGFMIALAVVFGPIALPIVVLVVLVVWIIAARHVWRPFLLFTGMVTGVILAEVLAPIIKHPRPPISLMLFGADHTFSFPSGHVLGTSDFLLILVFLFASRIRRTWFTVTALAVAILGIAAQVISRLYLGYHWISDTTASIALSMVIVGTLIMIDTHRTVRTPGERVVGQHSQPQTDGT